MTLLKDLIDIPDHVGKGDFVFTLENAVSHPQEVLKDYVVTKQLQECFDEALELIKSAQTTGESRASYLHGSFGSGKSHFMAVLYLLLSQTPEARAVPELQAPLAEHDGWLEGKKFLLIPVHMINSGADTLEKAIFTAYLERMDDLHQDAATPALFLSQPLIENALGLRVQMGDDKFFDGLNKAASGQPSGLGKLATSAWSAETFESAKEAKPGTREHDSLVGALLESYFTSYADVAGDNKFVQFDEGLNAMSRHAKELGYDGVILFLDELILWLATRIADMAFVGREGQKLTTLREAPLDDRPAPITSFVARQRDLRELIGEHYPGAEQLGFHDALSYSEGRFSTITLEDRNLRLIAEKRVLKPNDDEAKAQIDEAFSKTMRAGDRVIEVLQGRSASQEAFRAVYPFSPAFIDTLVAASSALQRERTAIRVMVQLLSERRDELELGDLVPVGDLFDVLSGADEPFSVELKRQFQDAKTLYANRLRPQIAETVPGVTVDDGEPFTGAAKAEDRLIKTLLLAALIPDAEPLRGLTVSRLVALNHGTIATPIPGEETSTALAVLRRLRGSVGQLKIQDGSADPTIQIELSGIDTERIIEAARGQYDNSANRRKFVRDFVRNELGLGRSEGLFERHSIGWRGTRREIEITLENVREIPADRATSSGVWKLIIDFPFDSEDSSRRDDEARIEELKGQVDRSATVFWLPAFLTNGVQKDLGLLVTLNGLLVSNDRLNAHTSHLAPADTEKARQLLESQQSQLRATVGNALLQAYGLATPKAETIEGEEKATFDSLEPTLDLLPPVAGTLSEAVDAIGGQLFRNQYPAHPEFKEELTRGKPGKIWAIVERAAGAEGGRLDEIDSADRRLLNNIAEPLELGEMHEGPFVLGVIWRERFVKAAARESASDPTVGQLRQWINEPESRGMSSDLENLVILTHAAQTNLSFELHGGPFSPTGPSDLSDDLVLRAVELPSQEEWDAIANQTAKLFGISVPPLPTAHNLDRYGTEIKQAAANAAVAASSLQVAVKNTLGPALGLPEETPRLKATSEARELVDKLAAGSASDAFRALGVENLGCTPEELGRTLKQALSSESAIGSTNWDLIGGAHQRAEQGDARAQKAIEQLKEAATESEMVTPLASALRAAEAAVTAVVVSVEPETQGATVHKNLSVSSARDMLDEVADPDSTVVDLTLRTKDANEAG